MGWKWGCQPFSCPCSLNATHCWKGVYATCLSTESRPFVKSKPAVEVGIMLAKDRVVVSKLWITGFWLWSRLPYRCDSCKPMRNSCPRALSSGLVLGPCPRGLSSGLVLGPCPRALSLGLVLGACPWALSSGLVLRPCPWALSLGPVNQLLASVGWKWGCQPFSCPRSQNVTHCQKEVYATCLFKESRPFVKSKPPLPTRTLMSLRAAARFTGSFSLHHACKR